MRRLLAVFGLLASFTVQAGEFQNVRDVVVQIMGDKGSCSAVVISPTKLLTAKHCLDALGQADHFDVMPRGLAARVVRVDPKSDLMLLELKAGTFKKHTRLCEKAPEQDDRVVSVGYPLGVGQFVTEGLVQFRKDSILHISTPVIFGNSGGGTFQKSGCLIGIVSSGAGAKGQFVFHLIQAVDYDEIKRFLSEGTQSGETNSGSNGVSGVRKR